MFPLILLTTVHVITIEYISQLTFLLHWMQWRISFHEAKKKKRNERWSENKTRVVYVARNVWVAKPIGAQLSITNGSRVKNSAALSQRRNVHTDTLGPLSKQFWSWHWSVHSIMYRSTGWGSYTQGSQHTGSVTHTDRRHEEQQGLNGAEPEQLWAERCQAPTAIVIEVPLWQPWAWNHHLLKRHLDWARCTQISSAPCATVTVNAHTKTSKDLLQTQLFEVPSNHNLEE